jgi:hypothetical protein
VWEYPHDLMSRFKAYKTGLDKQGRLGMLLQTTQKFFSATIISNSYAKIVKIKSVHNH